MTYYIAVFKSRTQSLNFSDYLNKAGVNSTIINTPREASVGCGISVKFEKEQLGRVELLMRSFRSDAFTGFFKIIKTSKETIVTRV